MVELVLYSSGGCELGRYDLQGRDLTQAVIKVLIDESIILAEGDRIEIE